MCHRTSSPTHPHRAQVVTTLVRELKDTASAPAIRSNVLLILGDLCVRYTALVDRFVPAMAACISDDSPLIRKHAVITLTQVGAVDRPRPPAPTHLSIHPTHYSGWHAVGVAATSSALNRGVCPCVLRMRLCAAQRIRSLACANLLVLCVRVCLGGGSCCWRTT